MSDPRNANVFGAMLLVTGSCIGAGMIGLPVVSSLAGFIPSSLAMLASYIFTTLTGLLLLESTLWFDHEVNLLTLSNFALGKIGKVITWFLFLSLFYCLFIAYLEGLGQLLQEVFLRFFHINLSPKVSNILCAILAAAITYTGTHYVDILNRYLVLGLILSYFILVFLGLEAATLSHLSEANWNATFATIPILLICFGYQNLVPSLTFYLKKQIKPLRYAIIIGNLIPFFVYLIWNGIIIGLLPKDLNQVNHNVETVTGLLQQVSSPSSVLSSVKFFSLFAILTSFLPAAISFVDFLKDGVKKTHLNRVYILYGLVFIPPLLCSIIYPSIFLQALSFAGGFIDILLFGVIPALIVIIGRKSCPKPAYQVWGGVITPFMVLFLCAGVLWLKFSL